MRKPRFWGRTADSCRGRRRLPNVATLCQAIDNAEPVSVELRNYRKDGTEFLNHVKIVPVETEAGEVTHFVGFQQDVTARKEATQTVKQSAQFRRELHQITSATDRSLNEKVKQLLELGCDRLGVENGHIVNIDADRGHHTIVQTGGSSFVQTGTVTNLSETFCRKTIQQDGILAIHNAPEQGWKDDPAYQKWDIGCYIGAKLLVENTVYGTVCFVNQDPRDTSFSQVERIFVDLLSRWLSHVFERRTHERRHELDAQRLDISKMKCPHQ
ncbi:GAF domain-containing protein [Salinibaculum salinum]|uniref:GAF domain-containing protein n=1 Tax=Salinibaculum salinum TaxID=3131996 RepID=UPI0030EC0568